MFCCWYVEVFRNNYCVILQPHFCSYSTHQAADGSIGTFIFLSFFIQKLFVSPLQLRKQTFIKVK